MDYFKIFTIILLIIILCKLYLLELKDIERFNNAEQSIGGVDDANSINTLAQLARKLIDGGATVPGNLTIKGELVSSGSLTSAGITTGGITSDAITSKAGITANDIVSNGLIKFGGAGATGFQWGNEGGNGWSCLRSLNGGDNSFCMHNTHGNGTRLHPGGDVTIKNRNILAELDDLKATAVRKNKDFTIALRDQGNGAVGGGTTLGACGSACGGGANLTGTTDGNRTLILQIRQ